MSRVPWLVWTLVGAEGRYRTVEGDFLGAGIGNTLWLFRKDSTTGWRRLGFSFGMNFVRDSVPM